MLATCRREFPRLNGYVLIPHEAGATVAYISWMATITVVDVRAISQADYRLLIAIGGKEREFYARRVGSEVLSEVRVSSGSVGVRGVWRCAQR